MKRILTVLCILLSALMLLTACHSTIPLDTPAEASDTETTQTQSTEPLTETPTLPPETERGETETLPPDMDVTEPAFPIGPEITSAKADTTGTVVTHTPRTDLFIGTAVEDTQRMQINGASASLQNDTYIFYSGNVCEVCKRNLETLEETPACCDPFCTHIDNIFVISPETACPFNGIRTLNFLYENKLYYVRSYAIRRDTQGAAEWHDVFSSYDYMTDEYHAIEDITIPYNTNLERGTPPHESYQKYGHYCVYGDYAYSIQYRCVSGNGDRMEDYGRMLVRLDLKTDKSEDLMPVDGLLPDKASIFAIRDRKIYLTAPDGLWIWNPGEGSVRRIMSIDYDCTAWWNRGSSGLDANYAYLTTYHSPSGLNPSDGLYHEMPCTCLLRVDLKTGEPERLTDVVPDQVFMRDNAIYIVPQPGYNQLTEYWRLNVNPWKESTNRHKKYMVQILKIDLDSGKTETIGYCNPNQISGSSGIMLTKNGLFGNYGFFEFSSGITYTSSGEIYDDPKNGFINEPEYTGGPFEDGELPEGYIRAGEETWW